MKRPLLSPDAREIAACIVVAWFAIALSCAIVAACARLAVG